MRKSLLILILSLTGLVMMGCSLIGFAQIGNESQPTGSANDTGIANPEQQSNQPEISEQNSQPQNQFPTPVPTIDPLISAQSCIAKTWEVTGLSDYVIAAVPPELADEYNLQYEETKGDAYFKLTPDGKITLQANDLRLLFSAQAYVFSVPVTVQIDGTATGNYIIDSTTLTITNVDTGDLDVSAQAMGEDLIEPDQILRSIPLLNPPHNKARYSCEGDILVLTLSGYSGDIPPLVFQAVER